MGSNPFDVLSELRGELREKTKAREIERRAEEEKKRKEEAQKNLFKDTMQKLGVEKMVLDHGRRQKVPPKPEPIPFQKQKDDAQVLIDSLSDNLDGDQLIDSDEKVSYYSPKVSPDIPRKLRRGVWSVKGTLDLHGCIVPEAREQLVLFLNEQMKMGHRVVRIIHGQGHGSVGRKPVLKEKVPVWLIQRQEVLAFVQAPKHDGGAGALLVLLAAK